MSDPRTAFAQALADWTGAALGLAVSGGSDSMALLHLAHDWAAGANVALHVATVDHGLRAGSADEALRVAACCHSLSLPHAILRWQGWDRRGNLQDAARDARLTLLAEWARACGCAAIALGHTLDDQAETLLLRLARGSGLDGLAAMAARDQHHGAIWLRPLLGVTRAQLRDDLAARGVGWIDDPSNDNPAFDRVRTRQALGILSTLGLRADRLAQTAAALRQARDSLDWAARRVAAEVARLDRGDIVFDADALRALPPDMVHRLVAAALCQVASQPYRPRLDSLRAALAQPKTTLHGCLITRTGRVLRITREWNAVATHRAAVGDQWDKRWQITAPAPLYGDADIRALGESGLAQIPDWRAAGLPRASLRASPSVWSGTRLIAAPLAGLAPEWQAKLLCGPKDFFSPSPAH